MVDGGIVQGTGPAVWGLHSRGTGPAAGVGSAVCGLCSVAAEVDGRGGVAAAGGVLEGEPGGDTGVAGVAYRSSSAGATGPCRISGGVCVGREADGGAEGAERTPRNHLIYDVAGGVGGVVGEVEWTAGRGDWDAGGEPRASGDRKPDRFFCEHAGNAGGCIGAADSGRGTGAGEEASDCGAAASGLAV